MSNLIKSHVMLNIDSYWDLVDKSLKSTISRIGQERFIIEALSKLKTIDIIGFRLRTDKLLRDSNIPELWCAAFILKRGCNEDGFLYFRNWLISRGRETYYNSLDNPDYLMNELIIHQNGERYYDDYNFETFWYVAFRAFEMKTGHKIFEYIDYDKFNKIEKAETEIEFNWSEEEPETMKRICPKLYKKLWE